MLAEQVNAEPLSALLSDHPPSHPSQAQDISFLHVPHSLFLLLILFSSVSASHTAQSDSD